MSGILVKDENLLRQGLQYCKDYLGGSWADVEMENFEMAHITGGLSNILYKCTLKDDVPIGSDDPRQVLLRLYGDIIKESSDTVLSDSVVFTLLAERNMGPKLFGVFTMGRIEEYVPARVLKTKELRDPTISKACARIMARFHTLKMPMVKKPRWLFDTIGRYLENSLRVEAPCRNADSKNGTLLKTMLDHNLADEYQNLIDLLKRVHSPVVFCHNDFQEGNILYMADCRQPKGEPSDPLMDIVRPIDFEYSSYNYRGFDIGNHFCEWCYNYNVDTAPYYSANLEHFPNKQQQLNFIREYLRESNLSGDEEESLLVEANAFALASHFMWCLWSIVQSKKSQIVFGYLDYGRERLNAYFEQKPFVIKSIEDFEARRNTRQASR